MIPDEINGASSFGDWLRQRRRALDLTQVGLAELVGCAVVTIKKIEQGERQPSRQMAQLLADHLSIPPLLRNDFIRMARGHFVPSMASPQETIRPPVFLEHGEEPATLVDSPFVARERELDWLKGHLETAVAGNGRIIFVLGEAGFGKTMLMGEFARRSQERHPDLVVVEGHCNAQAGSGDPYLPFRDILGVLAGDLEAKWASGSVSREAVLKLWSLFPHTVEAMIEHGPNLIGGLVPGRPLLRRISANLPGRVDWQKEVQAVIDGQRERATKLEQRHLLEAVTQVLQKLAARRPLLLLLDDLQWVDDASSHLLFHLGRRLAGSRILLLGAYRPLDVKVGLAGGGTEPADQHPLAPVIGEFKRYFGDIQLDLNEQTTAEKRAFLEALLDSEPNRLKGAFRERLFEHTEGHPLFTAEILHHLQRDGNLIRDESGHWVEDMTAFPQTLPVRVEAVIEQRINRLNPSLQDTLAIAAVEGDLFTAQVVAQVQGMDEQVILRRLNRVLGREHGLVREQSEVTIGGRTLNRYRFEHVLFQDYLYKRLSQGERRLFHCQVGEALEAFFARESREILDRLLGYSDRVGEVLDRPYPDFLAAFAPALARHFWNGRDWVKAACFALCAGSGAMKVFAVREAIAAFEQAIKALDKLPDPPYRLLFEAIIRWEEAAFKFKPYADQLEKLGRAEQLARDDDDKPRLIQALHWTANVHLAKGLWRWAGPPLMECLELAEAMGNERLSVRPVYFKGMVMTFENPRESLDVLQRAVELTRKYEDSHIEALALSTKAQTHAQMGEFSKAGEVMGLAREALAHTDSPLTESDVDLLAGWTYLSMGDAERGVEYGRRGVEKAIATDNMDCICYGYACVGFGNLRMNRIEEAEMAFTEAVERSEVSGAIIPKLLGEAGLAMAQFFDGRMEAVADLEKSLEEMESYNNHVGAARVNHMLGTCLLQSGELAAAEDYLNKALDFYRKMEMRPYLIRTLHTLAQLFGRQNRPAEAEKARREAESLTAMLAV